MARWDFCQLKTNCYNTIRGNVYQYSQRSLSVDHFLSYSRCIILSIGYFKKYRARVSILTNSLSINIQAAKTKHIHKQNIVCRKTATCTLSYHLNLCGYANWPLLWFYSFCNTKHSKALPFSYIHIYIYPIVPLNCYINTVMKRLTYPIIPHCAIELL